MSDDPDSPPEREMKDFHFRQMKKTRVFDSPEDMPKERTSLLALSNKFGLTIVGLDKTLKVYLTQDILAADEVEGNSNKIVEGISALMEVSVELPVHHLALSSDELTLSVCGMSEEAGLSLDFYDVRTFINKARPQKLPFASFQPSEDPASYVQDLKWSPVQPSMLGICLSDGSLMILDVTDHVTVQAQLPAQDGITCIGWSPKGKQIAAGNMNATVTQYTPALQKKKVIPCPNFYSSDNPVKVLDLQWLRTYVFAVAYAAADGSPETPSELVVITLPKKDEKTEMRYLNFSELVYSTCPERRHHYYLSHIEEWDVVFAASAASVELGVIASQEDKNNWEVWTLEDASRAELPVTQNCEDTLPLGQAVDFTSQKEINDAAGKILPPSPTMLILSTDGVLCPFALVNLNPGAKPLVLVPTTLSLEGERLPSADSGACQPTKPVASLSAPVASSALHPTTSVASPILLLSSSQPNPFVTTASTAPTSFTPSSCFSYSSSFTPAPLPASHLLEPSTISSGSISGFSFSSNPPGDILPLPSQFSFSMSTAPSTFSFTSPSTKPIAEAAPAPTTAPQRLATVSPITLLKGPLEPPAIPDVKLSLSDRSSAVDTRAQVPQTHSFTSTMIKQPITESASLIASQPSLSKSAVAPASLRQVQTPSVQKPVPTVQSSVPTPQAALGGKAVEKQLQQRDFDPIMTGIMEEIAHFQKVLDDLKARNSKADFKVGFSEEMKELKKKSEDLHGFSLEIKETTESLHGDISKLNISLLEGFTRAEDGMAQIELSKDKDYLQLLYKKPLDPRSDEWLKKIRRQYQYAMSAVEDVNDVLDMEWEKHLAAEQKQRHMAIPGHEVLFATLASNKFIINQQQSRFDKLADQLTSLGLYKKTPTWTTHPLAAKSQNAADALNRSDNELDSLRDSLLKTKLDVSSESPVKMLPVKHAQLRNFLSKRQTPPVHSTAPANLSRSVFLSPEYYDDMDDMSSTSSLSQSLDPHPIHLELQEEQGPEPHRFPTMLPPASVPRHPTVVRTPSIQPDFGPFHSTPFTKVLSESRMNLGLSTIATADTPILTNKINLGGADSTALATKTVKHGAPPTEKAIPASIPAQQAAATAALRRQMANQKPAAVNATLTESTLKIVPQVVNVQELKDKGPPIPVSTVISPSVPAPAVQVVEQVLVAATNQSKRNSTQGILKVSTESSAASQAGFALGGAPNVNASVVAPSSTEQSSSKGFAFTAAATSLSFTSVSQGAGNAQVKDVIKFSFAGSGNNMISPAEEPFSLTPKSISPALGTGSSTPPPNMSGDPVRPSSTTSALRVEPQNPNALGGETLGSFSGLRVGQGDDDTKDGTTKPTAKGAAQFSFGSTVLKPAEDSSSTDVSKGTVSMSSGSLFKSPESNSKIPFSASQSSLTASALPISFNSLLAAPLGSQEEPKALIQPSDPTPPPEQEPSPEPIIESVSPALTEAASATDSTTAEPTATSAPTQVQTPPVPAPITAPNTVPIASITPIMEGKSPPTAPAAPTLESTTETTPAPGPSPATATPSQETSQEVTQSAPTAFKAPSSDKPGSIFTQSATAVTDSSTIGVQLVINTAAPAATTVTPTTAIAAATTSSTVFGQPAGTSASSEPAATGFGSTAFGKPGSSFGKPIFGQMSGFGQPCSSTSTPGGFYFGQSAFGENSGNAATGGGGSLFGGPTASNASSFSFGTSCANNASSTGTGLFGQSTTPAFGQQCSGFGQSSVFGSNTTTTSSTGFSFRQPSAFGSSSTASVFGQQPSSGSVFGQQPSTGVGLFGSSSSNAAGSSRGAGFFSGLGGKPSEDAANKNPFDSTASTGGFGQSSQTGTTTLFGNSGAKTFGFSQSSFGEQKPSGTFSTGGGSVASQGFGSFSTPSKPSSGFGSAPVFGTPPSFGGSPAFGGVASFGSGASFNNNMGSSGGKVFGEGTAAANMGGFGFASPSSPPSFGSMANQSTPSFGSLAQQGSGFGAQPSGFGQPTGFVQQPQGAFTGGTFGSTNQSAPQTFASWRS
ncbi:nuclear pore complex protein Nup214 [Lampris incognitus]|uniref:nuclear pore complex protein Nup214 n=1 Tax=Lampris incognitus TaxID=2546036 RepID=UPI0024B583B2|nr:nuclear pore complex protein Nup214 [Lampris incognitus]